MVEFALIAPLFFFLFFSVINGGIFLFSRSAIQHSANSGSVQWATQGSASGADAAAFNAMDSNGLKNIVLTKVSQVTLQLMSQNSTTGVLTAASTCGSGGTQLCEQVFTPSAGGTCPVAGWTCTTQNWPASARNDGEDGLGGGLGNPPDFAQATIYYSYSTIGSFATFHLTANIVFRLEPQSL